MSKILNLLAFIFVIPIITRSQSVDSALANFNRLIRFEKAYVHFDNTRYTAGQTIWYKAYLMTGEQPSVTSKHFYIDWYDDKGQLMKSTVTPVIYCYSSGNFPIPQSYSGRFVRAIAYTKWMQNFDPSYFFEQRFEVISTTSKTAQKSVGPRETTAQFLPESGTLLSSKLNVIAFKAINNLGLPESIHGIVKDSRGDSILSFKSAHNGMGKFQFKTTGGESYSAIWTDLSGTVHRTNLPAPEVSAVNLLLEQGRTNRIFHIQRTETVPDRMKQLTLVGQMNGAILFKANVDLSDKETITGNLPVSKISSGILQLTVFDANAQPLCERIVFVRNEDYLLKATLMTDTLSTNRRGRNVLEICLNDTTYANLSISVTDADLNNIPENNIVSQLLLKGDLPGNVYEPGYYFASDADSVLYHLDLVMLTNGWRRYNWEAILQNQLPVMKYAKDSGYESIRGRISDYKAVLPDSTYAFDTTGSSGFQALAERRTNSAIRYQSLKEVTIQAKHPSRQKELDQKYTNGIFAGEAAAAFDMSTLGNASHRSSLFDFLTGKVQGLEVGGTNGGTATEGVVEYRRGAVSFYLDETAISASEAVNINLDNVAYIKVFSPPFAGGLNGSGGQIASGGAIAIYSKKGADAEAERNHFDSNGMESKLASGYVPGKEFYSPNYAEKTLSDDSDDLRSTLLWDPWITLDRKNQKVRIAFYNNDVANSFRVVLEGMDGAGKLVHISKILR
jgi:hypothetical protein